MQAAPLPDRIARNLSENSHCPPSPGYIQAPAGHSLWTPRRWADPGTRHDNLQQNLNPNSPGHDPPEAEGDLWAPVLRDTDSPRRAVSRRYRARAMRHTGPPRQAQSRTDEWRGKSG